MRYTLSYQQLFQFTPNPYLVLQASVDFAVVAVNDKYLEIIGAQREDIVGYNLSDLFFNNPDGYSYDYESSLRLSLHDVLSEKHSDVVYLPRDAILQRDAGENLAFEYWKLINTPVFDDKGCMTHIIHCLEEVNHDIPSSEYFPRDNKARPIKTGAQSNTVGANQRYTSIREQLRKTEIRFQAFFDLSAMGMAIVSLMGNWLHVNRKLCQIVGYSRAELRMLTYQDITHPDDHEADLDYVQRTLSGKITAYSMEKRYICKDRSIIWINLTVSLVRKPNGEPDYFICTIEDIQARKETEATLKEVERLASLGHWKWDIKIDKVVWSEELYRIVGRDPNLPFFYQDLSQFFVEKTWAELQIAVERCIAEGRAYEIDGELIRPDNGMRIWTGIRGEAIHDVGGKVIALQGTMQDITERKLAEMALQESREQLKLFIDYAPAAMAMFDLKLNHLAYSQRWYDEYYIGDRESLLGVSIYDAFPEIDEVWRSYHRRCLAGEVIHIEEYPFKRADGRIQWIRGEVRPWYTGGGEIGGIIIFSEDITQWKQAEETHQLNAKLEKLVEKRTAELNALNQSLESFVYAVSHDLKAPLRGVEGYCRLLEEDYIDRLDDEGGVFLSNIRSGVTRMSELINDLLAYSRMERCKLQADVMDLGTLVQRVLAEYDKEIISSRIEVMADLPAFRVQADREGLMLVIRNLLGNAIKFSKYSPQPRIEFGASQNDNHVTLWIRDNGIGFDMKYSEKIFEIFERLHRQEDYPGTGIGLALVKKAMQCMKGRVWVQSAPGEGAVFYLELPVAYENLPTAME